MHRERAPGMHSAATNFASLREVRYGGPADALPGECAEGVG
jgi:hypothetical protein